MIKIKVGRNMNNIPQVIRDSLSPSLDKRDKYMAASEKIAELYPISFEKIKTRKGEWNIARRKSYYIPYFIKSENNSTSDGFCAEYRQENTPKTFITGNTADPEIIKSTLNCVSKKIIEQRGMFSYPAKNLNAEKGMRYGIRMGFWIMFFLTIIVITDLILLPSYSEAISKGIAISFLGGESAGPDLTDYESITKKIVLSVFGEEYVHLSYSFYTLVTFFTIPVLIITIWAEIGGKRSDKIRMKGLPEDALDFRYGSKAVNGLMEEFELQKNEKKKDYIFRRLTDLGMKTEREIFQSLFEDMRQ